MNGKESPSDGFTPNWCLVRRGEKNISNIFKQIYIFYFKIFKNNRILFFTFSQFETT